MAFCLIKRGINNSTVKILNQQNCYPIIGAGVIAASGGTTNNNDNLHNSFNFDTKKKHKHLLAMKPLNESQFKFSRFLFLQASKATNPITRAIQLKQHSSNSITIGRPFSSKKSSKYEHDYDHDSDSSDDEAERHDRNKNNHKKGQKPQRGNSEFWRRKMRTLHGILDINNDGVISFDDFMLLAKKFTDLGHLTPDSEAEFMTVIKKSWEEQYGEIDPYNLVTAEAYLTDMHHMLNDKELVKKIGQFLPYFFKAVDTDHSGYLNLEQFKLFFNCLGLTDENAAVSFAVIDKNGDGKLSQKEFVKLGRDFFLTEDEKRVSKMFWGPLADH